MKTKNTPNIVKLTVEVVITDEGGGNEGHAIHGFLTDDKDNVYPLPTLGTILELLEQFQHLTNFMLNQPQEVQKTLKAYDKTTGALVEEVKLTPDKAEDLGGVKSIKYENSEPSKMS